MSKKFMQHGTFAQLCCLLDLLLLLGVNSAHLGKSKEVWDAAILRGYLERLNKYNA